MLLQREIRVVADARGHIVDTPNRWSGGVVAQRSQTPLVCAAVVSAPLDADGVAVEIRELDALVRRSLAEALIAGGGALVGVVSALFELLKKQLAPAAELVEVSLAATAQNRIAMQKAHTSTALVTQQFEFSAAHRLVSCADEHGRPLRDFGKCTRVHGHNYVLDVTTRVDVQANLFEQAAAQVEQIVRDQVLARLDHRYLNDDVAEMKNLNPTVEQIAVVIWNLLAPHLGAALAAVRLYETPKTWAEYRGPDAEPSVNR